jgi:3'(2'), 5'-bisphosphate nucleotidase
MPDLRRERKVALDLARQAGERIMGYYRTGLPAEQKAGDEPVTQADREADALISAGLRAAFPQDGMLTEESMDDPGRFARRRVWIVDPLDGTTEFLAETGEFSVMIGLAEEGEPVLGVIYQPERDRLYWAVRGQGAYEDTEHGAARLYVSSTRDPTAMCLTASRSHYSRVVERARQSLGIQTVERLGSVGLKVGLVAQGACDLYIATTISKEWDLCAPHALLEEAGGVLTSLCGDAIRYNKPEVTLCDGLVASNGRAHAQILDAIRPLVERT